MLKMGDVNSPQSSGWLTTTHRHATAARSWHCVPYSQAGRLACPPPSFWRYLELAGSAVAGKVGNYVAAGLAALELERVIATIAGQEVLAAATIKIVIARIAHQRIVCDVASAGKIGRAMKDQRLDIVSDRIANKGVDYVIAF